MKPAFKQSYPESEIEPSHNTGRMIDIAPRLPEAILDLANFPAEVVVVGIDCGCREMVEPIGSAVKCR